VLPPQPVRLAAAASSPTVVMIDLYVRLSLTI
jgi:hypothetical protein